MYSSMKLSDRTISYDTGLNLQKLNEDCDDDELGIVILPSSKKLLHNGTTKSTGVSERRRASRKTGKEHSFPVIFAVRTRQIHSGWKPPKMGSFLSNLKELNEQNNWLQKCWKSEIMHPKIQPFVDEAILTHCAWVKSHSRFSRFHSLSPNSMSWSLEVSKTSIYLHPRHSSVCVPHAWPCFLLPHFTFYYRNLLSR